MDDGELAAAAVLWGREEEQGPRAGRHCSCCFPWERKKNRAQGTIAMDRESGGRPWEVSLGGGAEGKGGALGGKSRAP
jgi:hypothetical protein